jgi:hypothetical protein
LRFEYEDGSARTQYIASGKQIAGTWFPKLEGADAGVAWRGANGVCGDVGVFWAAIANPEPQKTIARLSVLPADESSGYALIALTLASRMPYHAPPAVSFGGPDNWSAALVMYALVEGLAGVREADVAYRRVELSPRWAAAKVDEVAVTARYAASEGYVSYRYHHDAARRSISISATGNAASGSLRILMPAGAKSIERVEVNGKTQPVHAEWVRQSLYAVLPLALDVPVTVEARYVN